MRVPPRRRVMIPANNATSQVGMAVTITSAISDRQHTRGEKKKIRQNKTESQYWPCDSDQLAWTSATITGVRSGASGPLSDSKSVGSVYCRGSQTVLPPRPLFLL